MKKQQRTALFYTLNALMKSLHRLNNTMCLKVQVVVAYRKKLVSQNDMKNPYLFVCLDHGPDSRLWRAIFMKDELYTYGTHTDRNSESERAREMHSTKCCRRFSFNTLNSTY